jgi:hypothetical protein
MSVLLFGPIFAISPGLFFALIFLFIGPPAWIHYNWVFDPGYLFMSNGIRRLHFSEKIQAQISQRNNSGNNFGVPLLPVDLHTSASGSDLDRAELGNRVTTSARVVWDDYLYVAIGLLFPGMRFPRTSIPAHLELNPAGVVLAAGRWRPGILLQIPYSRIVGVWNGSSIPTIASPNVLVLVVGAENDEVLLPFEVKRAKDRTSGSTQVAKLVALTEKHRRQ